MKIEKCIALIVMLIIMNSVIMAVPKAFTGHDRESGNRAEVSDSRLHGNNREFLWQPAPSIPSGLYLVRAQFDNGEASVSSTKLLFMK